MIPVTRTEITPSSASAWIDVDVTSQLGGNAGSVAGVMLEIVNTSANELTFGVRKNGSTDTITGVIEDTGHTYVAIGIDSNDIFECYVSNIASIDVYIVGYIKNDEGGFLTNATLKFSSSNNVFQDRDISSDTGAVTGTCAFLLLKGAGLTQQFALRKNGSTDDRVADIYGGDLRGAMISVDANEIFESKSDDTSGYLVGWLTDNFTSFTNAIDYSTSTTGSWVDVNMSSDIPADNSGAMLEFQSPPASGEFKGGIRKNGESYDNYQDISEKQYLWCEIDTDRKAEQKIENVALDLWLWGYTSGAAGTAHQQPIADSFSITETQKNSSVKVVLQSVSITEAISKTGASVKTLLESLTIAEILNKKLNKKFSSSLAIVENITTTPVIRKLLNETCNISEIMICKLTKIINEIVTVIENFLYIASPITSVVDTTTTSSTVRVPPQRFGFYAANRFWSFHTNGTNAVFRSSTDGSTWTSATILGACAIGVGLDIFWDGIYVHYARQHSTYSDIRYRRGVPNSNGTITWSAVEQDIAAGDSGYDISLIVDSNGYPWIAYGQIGGSYYPEVIKSSANDGTWSTASGYPLEFDDENNHLSYLISLTNGKLFLIVYQSASSQIIRGYYYNGSSWGSIMNISTSYIQDDQHDQLCAVNNGDDIHLVFQASNGTIRYIKYSSSSWGSEVELASTSYTNGISSPVITKVGINELYIFWIHDDDILRLKYTGGSWESTPTVVVTDTDIDASYIRCLQSYYNSMNGYGAILYLSGLSPINIKQFLYSIELKTLTILESFAINETFSQKNEFERTHSETLAIPENVIKNTQKELTETVSIIESTAKFIQKLLTSVFSIIESNILKTVQKSITSFIDIVENMSTSSVFIKTLSATISIVENIISKISTVISNIVNIAESILFETDKKQVESVALSETNISDVSFKLSSSFLLSELLSTSTASSRSDILAIAEEITNIDKQFLLTEIVNLTETQILDIRHQLITALTLSEQLDNSINTLLTDTTPVSDSFNITREILNQDTISIAETIKQLLELKQTDSISFSDILNTIAEISIQKQDDIIISETITHIIELYQSDAMSLVDVITDIYKAMAFPENINISETHIIDSKKNFVETLILTKYLSSYAEIPLVDAFNTVDVISTTTGSEQQLAESCTILDSLFSSQYLSKLEALSITEAFSKYSEFSKENTETIAIDLSIKHDVSLLRTDSLTFVEFIAILMSIPLTDTVSISDDTKITSTNILTDIVQLSENVKKSINFKQFSNILFDDIITKTWTVQTTITDTIILDDTILTTEQYNRMLSEMFTFQDIITSFGAGYTAAPTDTLIIASEISKKDTSRTLSDVFDISEELTKSVSLYIISNITFVEILSTQFGFSQEEVLSIADHFKVDRYERLQKNKTILITNRNKTILITNRNKTHLCH